MQESLDIRISGKHLKAFLTIPENATNLILFSHGSGSGRLSPRNQFVAEYLQQAQFATLLIDLLTEQEDQNYQNRFDIELLTRRLVDIVAWLQKQSDTQHLAISLFGASTGAAAALKCCVEIKNTIKAVVSRGGRPDLAISVLNQIVSPTLLIVGGNDTDVVVLNKQAYAALRCIKKLEIIPGATHLFEEAGTLEKVALLARNWFQVYKR